LLAAQDGPKAPAPVRALLIDELNCQLWNELAASFGVRILPAACAHDTDVNSKAN